jgi:hypothetical protein
MVSLRNRSLHNSFGIALFAGLYCGIIGVLVDFDHPVAFALGIKDGRFLHPYTLIIGCGIFLACIAYIGGLLFSAFLKRRKYA